MNYDYVPIERVAWGVPAAQAVIREVRRLEARRVFIVASKTLSRNTEIIDDLRAALGSCDVGIFDDCKEHTPLQSVIACADAVRAAQPDLILTIGGGTPIDTVKLVQLCLSQNLRTAEALLTLAGKPVAARSTVRQLVVPTTLSGGEYSSFAGGTDIVRKTKDMYLGPDLCARVIVLDPAITQHTPEWLWLSTGIRALDHAIEGYCAPATNALVQATALHAIKLFSSALRRSKRDPADLAARHALQMAVWLAATSLGRVSLGASHGIGYCLGTLCGVPHGYTSCVMLPAVLRWNEPATAALQEDIAAAMGVPGCPASDAVAALLQEIGMPRRLGDVGVDAAMIPLLAAQAVLNPVVMSNPRPIRGLSDVADILALCL